MNVGDYVRYKYENIVYIGKIKFISETMGFDETLQFDIDNCMEEILKQDIIKSSPQIIDLIEENDYIRIITDTDFRRIYNSYGKLVIYRGKELPIETFSNKFIGEIITHEQMEAMQYRVEK